MAIALLIGWPFIFAGAASGADLPEIQKKGVLRHLGIHYASFVTGSGDGLDVELVKLFAQHLGVRYEFVESSWLTVMGNLTGKIVRSRGNDLEVLGEVPVKGDMIATGFTILPWRERIVDYSTPTFPTQVWLISRAESPLQPIVPSGDADKDIATVKALLKGHSVLGKSNTCLEPSLYNLAETGATIKLFEGNLNELAPAVINGDADCALLDVPDALIALEKWPGQIKVIGPLSPMQHMGCAFAKSSPKLRDAFNQFFEQCMRDGTYLRLVRHYYPTVSLYYGEFFKQMK
jgi:ABC-type amino acid transport substrate-binding protein